MQLTLATKTVHTLRTPANGKSVTCTLVSPAEGLEIVADNEWNIGTFGFSNDARNWDLAELVAMYLGDRQDSDATIKDRTMLVMGQLMELRRLGLQSGLA